MNGVVRQPLRERLRIAGVRNRDLVLPVALLAFMGPTVGLLSQIFTTNTRWAVLAVLSISVLVSSVRLRSAPLLKWTFIGYALICAGSFFWSESPQLSLMKGAAFLVVAMTFTMAGYRWFARYELAGMFDYLVPLVLVTYIAALGGQFTRDAVVVSGSGAYYQGLVRGTNMMGAMLSMSSIFVLWRIHVNRAASARRWAWTAIYVLGIGFIVWAGSRAALLIVTFGLCGYLFGMGVKKWMPYLLGLLLLLVLMMTIAPALTESASERLIYKYATEEQGILYTRKQPWDESLRQAKRGGWLGGGYGVSIGADSRRFRGGLGAVGYGREKGNSQLAIIEETGLLGFLLYSLTLLVFLKVGWWAFTRAPNRDFRAAIGLAFGGAAGMLAHSVFEAWWVAPGAPESAFFWSLAGVCLGLAAHVRAARRVRQQRSLPNVMPVTPHHPDRATL